MLDKAYTQALSEREESRLPLAQGELMRGCVRRAVKAWRRALRGSAGLSLAILPIVIGGGLGLKRFPRQLPSDKPGDADDHRIDLSPVGRPDNRRFVNIPLPPVPVEKRDPRIQNEGGQFCTPI